MNQIETASKNDAVLLPYLQATDETEASGELENLICLNAQNIIRDVIPSKLRVGNFASSDLTEDEAVDFTGEVTLKLVQRLRELSVSRLASGVSANGGLCR